MKTVTGGYEACFLLLYLSCLLGQKLQSGITAYDSEIETTQINDEANTFRPMSSHNNRMDKLMKLRKRIHSSMTKACDEASIELTKVMPNVIELRVHLEKLNELWSTILKVNQNIMNMLVHAGASEEEMDNEANVVQNYNDRIRRIRVTINMILSSNFDPSNSTSALRTLKKTYQLPKIEIKKFNGELTEWLSFWSQFQKIDEDEDLHDSDKLQYLVQSMVPGTKGSNLVNSYPLTGSNYAKVIAALKERFGDKKLLGDIYARELLKMTIHGANSKNGSLSSLYDKLQTNLHALESIDIAAEGPYILLLPMVESSLPEEVLRAWQRSPLSSEDGSTQNPKKTSLDFLMEFLRKEVKNEERIELAKRGFEPLTDFSDEVTEISRFSSTRNPQLVATRKYLLPTSTQSSETGWSCPVCDDSIQCGHRGVLSKITYVNNKVKNKEHSCCIKRRLPYYTCFEIICTFNESFVTVYTNESCVSDVYLPTIMITVGSGETRKRVRVLLDSGSQRSYISKLLATELGLRTVYQLRIYQAINGGTTGLIESNKYELHLYQDKVETHAIAVLGKDKVCEKSPRVKKGLWLQQLEPLRISSLNDLSDDGEDPDIELLIGADFYGSLITGKLNKLNNGLTALETLFGWTLFGTIQYSTVNE